MCFVQHWLCSRTATLNNVMHDCHVTVHVKQHCKLNYANNTTLVNFIRDGEELADWEEVNLLVDYKLQNINVSKIIKDEYRFRNCISACWGPVSSQAGCLFFEWWGQEKYAEICTTVLLDHSQKSDHNYLHHGQLFTLTFGRRFDSCRTPMLTGVLNTV